jgi:hypothetical protein
MNIVFANTSAIVSHPQSGVGVSVGTGQHWPADDPVVEAYPQFFTDDPRFGLSSSRALRDDGYPEGYPTDDKPSTADAVETTDATPGTKRRRS